MVTKEGRIEWVTPGIYRRMVPPQLVEARTTPPEGGTAPSSTETKTPPDVIPGFTALKK